jgi:hypothetical protein
VSVVLDPAEQLAFDGIESATAPDPVVKRASIAWSYSRRGVLEQCPLRYYYEYYGSNLRTAEAEPRKEQLRFLKKLSNRHLRAGDIAHFVIRAYLNRLQGGEEWSVDRVVGWAREVYRGDLEFSRGYRRGETVPSGLRAPVLLSEFYYGVPNAIELWEESEAQLAAALMNFVRSPKLEPFRVGGGRPDALVETRFKLKQERFSAVGMMDLAYPEDGRIVVVDWKMGEGAGDDVLQLYAYALEAVRRFGCNLADLTLYRVSLVDDEVSSFMIGVREASRAEVRILQDLETMEGLDWYGREAVAAAFTPCGQSRVCALCPFQEFCPKE